MNGCLANKIETNERMCKRNAKWATENEMNMTPMGLNWMAPTALNQMAPTALNQMAPTALNKRLVYDLCKIARFPLWK
jgi:hypothetical protein